MREKEARTNGACGQAGGAHSPENRTAEVRDRGVSTRACLDEPIVKSNGLALAALALVFALPAAAQNAGKIGVINLQTAIMGTKDGQKATNDIQTRFNPKKAELEKRQSDIGKLQEQLNPEGTTLGEQPMPRPTPQIERQ